MSFQKARKSFFWRVSYQFGQTLYSRPVRDWKRPFKRLLNGKIVKCFKTVAASQRRSIAAGQEECPEAGNDGAYVAKKLSHPVTRLGQFSILSSQF